MNMEDANKEIERLRARIKHLEKLASLGSLSAGIAHEIQNPLNFIINFSKLSTRLADDMKEILSEAREQLPPEYGRRIASIRAEFDEVFADLRQNLLRIEEHGTRATSVIRGILLYSRGKDDVLVPTDIKGLVSEYVRLAYHSARANHKGFKVCVRERFEEGVPAIKVVPQDLGRAILNLMSNACYAVRVKAEQAPSSYEPTIAVDTQRESDWLLVCVADNGIGMSRETLKEAFTPFFTTKPAGEGTGLGLSITRSIIEEKHKGRVEVESKEGEGTRFTLYLPITK